MTKPWTSSRSWASRVWTSDSLRGVPSLQPSNQFRNLRKNARALGRKLADRGIKLADIFLQTAPEFVSLAPNHPNPRRRARARHLLANLGIHQPVRRKTCLGAARRLFPGRAARGFLWPVLQRSWPGAADKLRAAGITFSVEAHVGSLAPLPKDALRLVQATPGLTLTLDYTHFVRRGIGEAEVEPLIAHASHFHARGARKGRLQTSFKQNTIDYARILSVMKSTGYRGYIGVEYSLDRLGTLQRGGQSFRGDPAARLHSQSLGCLNYQT